MTYGITDAGFTLKEFEILRAEIEAYQKLHIDDGLDLSDDSPLGQINVSHILKLAELWQLAQKTYVSRDPDQAGDWALDVLAAMTGTYRSPWAKTIVNATVVLDPYKSLPAGSIANLTGRPNSQFILIEEIEGSDEGGSFDAVFEAASDGAIVVVEGQLSEIAVAVDGWVSVDNTEPGLIGSQPERDEEFRMKRERELSASGSSTLNSIISTISQTSGVIDVYGAENNKSIIVDGIPPHSVHIIVYGGVDADIADAIWRSRGAGTGMYGTKTGNVTDSEGVIHVMRWDETIERIFSCTINVNRELGWITTDGISKNAVKQAVFDYITALKIGQSAIYDKIRASAVLIDGVKSLASCIIKLDSESAGVIDLAVAKNEIIITDLDNITVTVVS